MTPRGPTHAFTPPFSNAEHSNGELPSFISLGSTGSIVVSCDDALFKAFSNVK